MRPYLHPRRRRLFVAPNIAEPVGGRKSCAPHSGYAIGYDRTGARLTGESTVGYSVRYFLAEDHGNLTRVPRATYRRWFSVGDALPDERAGCELRLLEVLLEVDRHSVVGVLRILPFRQRVRADGRLDVDAAMRLAHKRLDILGSDHAVDPHAQIEQLEVDANSFWWPAQEHLEALGRALLGRRPDPSEMTQLRAVVFSPGGGSRDG